MAAVIIQAKKINPGNLAIGLFWTTGQAFLRRPRGKGHVRGEPVQVVL
jgi:hypothetical protein